MAKTQRSKGYSIYPYLWVKTGPNSKLHYLNIRVVKKDVKPIDIGIYTDQGERVKIHEDHFIDHDIKSVPNRNDLNERVSDLLSDIKKLIDSNNTFTKESIENEIYPNNLMGKSKNQRVKHLSIPIYQQVVNAEFQGLFKEVQKAVEQDLINKNKGAYTDESLNLFTTVTLMNLFLDNQIQQFFSKDISDNAIQYVNLAFPAFKDILFFKRLVAVKTKYPELVKEAHQYFEANREFLFKNNKAKFYDNNKIFTYNIVDYVTLNKTETTEFKTLGGRVTNVSEVIEYKEQLATSTETKQTLEARATAGTLNSNLIELFQTGFFLTGEYEIKKRGTLWALLQYCFSSEKPSLEIQSLNYDWCKNFITYIFKIGVITKYDVDQLDRLSEKYFEGVKSKYSPNTKKDQIKRLMMAIRRLSNYYNLNIDVTDEKNVNRLYESFKNVTKPEDEAPQNEKFITKYEFDQLYKFTFEDKELELTRDRFILQVMFGGLRISEFYPLKNEAKKGGELSIQSDGHGKECVSYIASKTGLLIKNPLTEYTDTILKKYNGIPFFKDKKGNIIRADSSYNDSLKKMAKVVGIFDRKVKDNIKDENTKEMKSIQVSIKEDISSRYARSTAYEVLETLEGRTESMSHESAMLFIGHSFGKNESRKYKKTDYVNVQLKRNLIIKYNIKPE